MVVMGVTRSAVGTIALRRKGVEGRTFGVVAESSSQPEATVATAGVAVTSLLALQESESELQHDREARQHGTAVVDELSALQRALLGGEGPDLNQMAQLIARPIHSSDPHLAGVLKAVRLRAEIELARRGRAA